jgi:hypothetical protein
MRGRGASGAAQKRPLLTAQRDALALYRDLERALSAAGRARPPSTTPLEHAEALGAEGFGAADATRAITDAYLRARFGAEPLDGRALAALRERLREVRRAKR